MRIPKIKISFERKKPELKTGKYALIKLTELSKSKGIDDDENKEIVIFDNGKIIEKAPYIKGFENILRDIDNIPVIFETLETEEKFKLAESGTFGQINYKRFL